MSSCFEIQLRNFSVTHFIDCADDTSKSAICPLELLILQEKIVCVTLLFRSLLHPAENIFLFIKVRRTKFFHSFCVQTVNFSSRRFYLKQFEFPSYERLITFNLHTQMGRKVERDVATFHLHPRLLKFSLRTTLIA